LPALKKPFAALLDASDREWSDTAQVERLAKALLDAGCRYFVCFGPGSEVIHDRIDDVIVQHELNGVTTTFHEDEEQTEVAEFFTTIATVGMNDGLFLVRDVVKWKAAV
jgi:hypothetical protein